MGNMLTSLWAHWLALSLLYGGLEMLWLRNICQLARLTLRGER